MNKQNTYDQQKGKLKEYARNCCDSENGKVKAKEYCENDKERLDS